MVATATDRTHKVAMFENMMDDVDGVSDSTNHEALLLPWSSSFFLPLPLPVTLWMKDFPRFDAA